MIEPNAWPSPADPAAAGRLIERFTELGAEHAALVATPAGAALLGTLFIFATWNDLTHLGLFRWVAGLIG